jgi:ribokinase
MSSTLSICVVGSCNVDLTFRAERLPQPGETLPARSVHLGHGGKGANQAVMAARLGARVSLIGRVGRDAFGEQALAHYRAEGIDTTHVRLDAELPTGTAAIVVDDRANNCILVVPGANGGVSPDDVRAAEGVLASSRAVLCQLETPLDATLTAFGLARAHGVTTILNPAPAADLPDELLHLTDLCIPNETEAERLTGMAVTTLEQAEQAAASLRSRGPRAVLLTLGHRGVWLDEENGQRHLPTVAVEAIDPTGAGDAFIGALAMGLLEGRSLAEAGRRAAAVAALTVTRPGAQSAFPTRAEAEAFLKVHGMG